MALLHENIKFLMKKKRVSARAVARECNIPQSTMAGLLSGKREPSVKFIVVLANYFETSTDFLLTGKESSGSTLNSLLTEEVFEGLLKVKIERVVNIKKVDK